MEPDEMFYNIAQRDKQNKVYYSPDDQGKYILETNFGFPEAVVGGLFMSEELVYVEEARKAVLSGRKSPLYYHMERRQMLPGMLAKAAGIAAFRVRRHLRPEIFCKLKPSVLDRYAEALAVTREELKTVPSR
jgi:hypothetical protein